MAFAYAPLKGDNAFRLLRLLGGKGDVVECELFHANTDYSKLQYEAVSYCWGSEQRECAILIDGKTLMVRGSLSVLLKHLRNPNPRKHRTIWIDAICIDQENKSEQGHQVQQMRKIYASARRVIFWLGEPTPDVRLLMIALDAFNRAAKAVGWNLLEDQVIEQNVWYEAVTEMHKNSPILNASGRMREGLRHLLNRSWFSRAWIIQEVANARRGIIQCGKMVIACRPFTLAPKLLGLEANPHCRSVLDAMPTRLRTTSWWSDDRDLFSVIRKFRHSESTLDRDRIYALRGLCTFRDDKTFLSVNYQQPVCHVINDAISHICMCNRRCLPESLYSSMDAFLDDLETMHRRVLLVLLKSEDIEGVENILHHHPTSIKVSPLMLSHAVVGSIHGPSLTRSLLEFSKGQVTISESTILAAFGNQAHGPALTKMLLEVYKGKVEIPESTILASFGNEKHGPALTKVLLKFCKKRFEITEEIMLAACENRSHGSSLMTLLLPYAQNTNLSPAIFIAAARNPTHTGPIMEALIEYLRPNKETLARELSYTILVREKAEEGLIRIMFKHLALAVEVDEDIAVAAARNQDDLLSLDPFFQSGKLIVTERILLAAAGNLKMGPKIVQYLLRNPTSNDLKITEELVAMMIDAVDNSWEGTVCLQSLLLDHGGENITIGDRILKSILRHRKPAMILDLLQARQGPLCILQNEADVAAPDDEVAAFLDICPCGQEALCWAIQNDEEALFEFLIEKGVEVSGHSQYPIFDNATILQRESGKFSYAHPLYSATEKGNLSMIRLLLDHGAEINQSPSPLIAAMGNDHVFQFLIEHGAKADGGLLLSAACLGHVWAVEFALHNSKEEDIDYSLIHAAERCQIPVVEVLLKAGARVDARDSDFHPFSRDATGCTPLHLAARATNPDISLIELLLQHGAGVNEKSRSGMTPLSYAYSSRHWKAYQRLLEAGAYDSTFKPIHGLWHRRVH